MLNNKVNGFDIVAVNVYLHVVVVHDRSTIVSFPIVLIFVVVSPPRRVAVRVRVIEILSFRRPSSRVMIILIMMMLR